MLHILDHVQMGNKRRLSRSLEGLNLAAWRDESGSCFLFVWCSHVGQRWLAYAVEKALEGESVYEGERITTQTYLGRIYQQNE